jgi:hypothetical protein
LALSKEHVLKIFEYRALKKVFAPKIKEVTGE